MSRHDLQRLDDIRAACLAIAEHLTHGDLGQGLIFDAVRVRLIEIGEAVKAVDPDLPQLEAAVDRLAARAPTEEGDNGR